MAQNYTINTNQLTEGDIAAINGKVSFSHASQPMSDNEIDKENERRRKNNMTEIVRNNDGKYPTYSYLEIYDVQVVVKNPNAPTPFETFLIEHCYQTPNSKKHPNAWCYTGKHAGNGVADVWVAPDGKNATKITLEAGQELAEGLNVTLYLKVYKPKNRPMQGVALETIVVNEPLKFYKKSAAIDLAAQGYIVNNNAPAQKASDVGQQVAEPVDQVAQQVAQQVVAPQTQAVAPQVAPQAQSAPMFAPANQVAAPQTQAVAPQVAPQATAPTTARPPMVAAGTATQGAQQVAQQGSAFGNGQGISYDPESDKVY